MASRPVFVSEPNLNSFIYEMYFEFNWFPGMAVSQKQKSIRSLHEAVDKNGLGPCLEISSKSEILLGVKLSAFNLRLSISENIIGTVESIYQGSKVFKEGGPYTDLYKSNSRDAKKDFRLYESGTLISFQVGEQDWDLFPETAFYDWLYINALVQNENYIDELLHYKSFTDIEFNPKLQMNCQARSAAYFVSLTKLNLLKDYLGSKKDFIALYNQRPPKSDQYGLAF